VREAGCSLLSLDRPIENENNNNIKRTPRTRNTIILL